MTRIRHDVRTALGFNTLGLPGQLLDRDRLVGLGEGDANQEFVVLTLGRLIEITRRKRDTL